MKQQPTKPLLPLSQGVSHDHHAPVLSVNNVTIRYNGTAALDDVSFQLARGERLAVVGPNGAGKSTLLKAIAGLLHVTSGTITVYGHAPNGHICIAYVPQRTLVDWQFPVTVSDVVMMGRTSKIGWLRRPSAQDRAYVQECLALVGMQSFARRQIGALSGGQQQRVFIARALAQEAELMLMDEPLTGLDMPSQEEILAILALLRERAVTVMVSTHDLNQAAEQFDRVLLIKQQLIGIGKAADVFTLQRLATAYGSNIRTLNTLNEQENNESVVSSVLIDTCCSGGVVPHE